MAEFDLSVEIEKILKDYTTGVQVAVENAVEECGKGIDRKSVV